MKVNPGELNKRIQIIRNEETQTDADGFPIQTEQVVRECYAKVSRVSGTEKVKANADIGEIVCRFLVRTSTVTIDRGMMVRYKDELYDIQYPNDYGDRGEYTEILTIKRGPDCGKI